MSSSRDVVLKVENLSKVYRLGEVGTGTISHDLNRWFAKIRGKEDPFSTVGSVNDRTQTASKGEYVKALSDINFEVKEHTGYNQTKDTMNSCALSDPRKRSALNILR